MILKNDEEAKDMSQTVVIEYFMSINKYSINNLDGWVYVTTRNKCYNYIKKRKRDIIFNSIEFNEQIYIEPNSEKSNCIDDDMTEMIKALPSDVLNMKEKELLVKYYKNNCEYTKLCAGSSIKKDSLRKKIYRLKSEVIAYNKRMNGYNNSIEIAGPRLRENILNFVKKFNCCCRESNFSKMKQYFTKCIIPKEIPPIRINTIIHTCIDYRDLRDLREFGLCITYYNDSEKINSFSTIFRISDSNSIIILEFPKLSNKIFKANINALPKEVLEKILPDKKGRYYYSFDEVKLMIKEHTELITVIDKN